MTKVKKITAFFLAAAMLLCMNGCSLSDTSWAAKAGNDEIPAGVYIYYIVSAYQQALYQVEDSQKDVLKQTVEDMDASAWIANEAQKGFETYMATEQEFKRLGLSLDEATLQSVDSLTEQMWAYYGTAYEDGGISKDSYKLVLANAYKHNSIFQSYYGEGGEYEVADSELKDYFSKEYAKLKYLYIPYEEPAQEKETEEGDNGEASDGEEAQNEEKALTKEEALAQANNYLEQVKAGAALDEVIDEYNKSQGKEVDAADESRNVNYLQTSESTKDMPLVAKAFSMPFDSPEVFSTEGRVYLIARYDVLTDPADFEKNRDSLLESLKYEEFEGKLTELTENLDYTMNDAAVKRYSVKSVVGKIS